MFANPRYTVKNAPVFLDSARFETEHIYFTALRASIMNDEDSPPKALIELDMYLVPASDIDSGEGWKSSFYDLEASVCLTPEDTILLIRRLSRLLGELFNDHNYLTETVKYRAVKIKQRAKEIEPIVGRKGKKRRAKNKD